MARIPAVVASEAEPDFKKAPAPFASAMVEADAPPSTTSTAVLIDAGDHSLVSGLSVAIHVAIRRTNNAQLLVWRGAP
jgi:hypothetical protein